MEPIIFNSKSSEFNNKVLIWENQVDLILETTQPIFYHQVQKGPIVAFTIQSLLQAFCKKQYKTARRKKDSKLFRIIDISILMKV